MAAPQPLLPASRTEPLLSGSFRERLLDVRQDGDRVCPWAVAAGDLPVLLDKELLKVPLDRTLFL